MVSIMAAQIVAVIMELMCAVASALAPLSVPLPSVQQLQARTITTGPNADITPTRLAIE